MTHIETPEQAKQDPAYLKALTELLYQLADDDFIISFRGSEWLGLAPHVEEDVAFSSITQNTMGHATLFYNLLEELGQGDADVLAHERPSQDRKNAIYFEKKNGDGSYLDDPYYDWALTVVRQYFYEVFKKIKMEAVSSSSYEPLANAAKKVLMEQPYHLAHWKIWMKQLLGSTEDAKTRMQFRIEEAWNEFQDVLDLGSHAQEMEKHGLIELEASLKERWLEEIEATIDEIPEYEIERRSGSGRGGEHSDDLDQALAILSEVYVTDKKAVW